MYAEVSAGAPSVKGFLTGQTWGSTKPAKNLQLQGIESMATPYQAQQSQDKSGSESATWHASFSDASACRCTSARLRPSLIQWSQNNMCGAMRIGRMYCMLPGNPSHAYLGVAPNAEQGSLPSQ